MEELKNKIKEFALSKGADLVGIASVSRFNGAPDGHKPVDILPDAKNVIACAKRFPNSVVMEGPATSYHHMMTILVNQLDWVDWGRTHCSSRLSLETECNWFR